MPDSFTENKKWTLP